MAIDLIAQTGLSSLPVIYYLEQLFSSGFKSEFCCQCGSPVPNISSNGDSYWVPAGLLSEPVDTKVSAHVYVGSHASWDVGFMNDGIPQFDTMPTEQDWLKICEK
ncbi:GFA family protein [Shewanella algae]|uniref:GFA family protein n=1 Tax=Shewanella algae TaxID=38313 RepID=UPI001C8248D8|nr:hypothetical protein [Shewanella algae]